MLILLRDCFVDARIDPDNPNRVFVRSRQKGDIERFAGPVDVKASGSADYAFRAEITKKQFDISLKRASDEMSSLSLVESVAERDVRRRQLYAEIMLTMSTEYGSFGIPGLLAGLNPGYPPDLGLPDDEDVARFLKE